MLRQLGNDIRHLNYVVQRNWDNLPNHYEVDGHGDLDLFVSDEDRDELLDILENYMDIPIDVRSPQDHYYPPEISTVLLWQRRNKDGFWIPNQEAAFLALYYHGVVHKEKNPYDAKLKQLFLEWIQPVECEDKGVGFYV